MKSSIHLVALVALGTLFSLACRSKPPPAPEPAAKTEVAQAPSTAPAIASAAATPTAAKGPKLTEAECHKVIEHVLDVTAREVLDEEGTKTSAADKKKHLAALRAELANDPELKKHAENCDEEYTRSEYICMMGATTGDALEKCSGSPP